MTYNIKILRIWITIIRHGGLGHEVQESWPQGPHSHILMTGASDRGSYFIPKKIPTSEFVYRKKSLLFLVYPKKSLSVFASANFIIYLLES